MDMSFEFFQKIDWPNVLMGSLLPILGTFLVWLIGGLKEYNKISKALGTNIKGEWFSAEFDYKHPARHALLKVQIKRKIGNKVIIRSLGSINSAKSSPKNATAWEVEGKIIGETIIGEWDTTLKNTRRYGAVIIKFLDKGRAVGYWIGYGGAAWPRYGYWLMNRDPGELKKMNELVLSDYDFKAYDVANLIENFDSIIEGKIDVRSIPVY